MTIDLTPAETSIILKALSTQPYNEAAALIRRIVEKQALDALEDTTKEI